MMAGSDQRKGAKKSRTPIKESLSPKNIAPKIPNQCSGRGGSEARAAMRHIITQIATT